MTFKKKKQKKLHLHLFKFFGLVLLRPFQEVQQYDVTQHCSLDHHHHATKYNSFKGSLEEKCNSSLEQAWKI